MDSDFLPDKLCHLLSLMEVPTHSVPLHVVLHDSTYNLPPEVDLGGVLEVGKVRGWVPHDLEAGPQIATPELVHQSVQSSEVDSERARRLQGDQVEEPVDADLSHGSRRQAADEGQIHGHICINQDILIDNSVCVLSIYSIYEIKPS